MKVQDFKREFSAGCVVFKKAKKGFVFLLGKHSGYHKWVFPKGLIEEDERDWQTALRETEEELGVKAKLVDKKPIHKEQYFFYASYKDKPDEKRRVEKYKESFDSAQDKGSKTKVFKTVSFYLAEFVSGDPKKHGWEMEEAGWFDYKKAMKLMAFKGEKEALKKAKEVLEKGTQGSLF